MKTQTINVYEFAELSAEAKENALNKWYENEDYPFLQDDLTESLKALLTEKECDHENIELLYSLSCSQGDGLCFTGTISKNGNSLILTHNYRYYFAKSVNMLFEDKDGNEIEECKELTDIYFSVCSEIEKEGYSILEYRMTNLEFTEHCEANNYEFDESGNMI